MDLSGFHGGGLREHLHLRDVHLVRPMLALQSALLVGSLSWSPWYEAWPVHWLLVTTNLTCVATSFDELSNERSDRSGATGRGLTDGNASDADETTFVQPAAMAPSQVGFPAFFPAHASCSPGQDAEASYSPLCGCLPFAATRPPHRSTAAGWLYQRWPHARAGPGS
jgi:hypothetical protein